MELSSAKGQQDRGQSQSVHFFVNWEVFMSIVFDLKWDLSLRSEARPLRGWHGRPYRPSSASRHPCTHPKIQLLWEGRSVTPASLTGMPWLLWHVSSLITNACAQYCLILQLLILYAVLVYSKCCDAACESERARKRKGERSRGRLNTSVLFVETFIWTLALSFSPLFFLSLSSLLYSFDTSSSHHQCVWI